MFPDWDADDCVDAVRQKCELEAIRLTDAAAQLLAESQNYDDVFLNEHSVRCARLGAGARP